MDEPVAASVPPVADADDTSLDAQEEAEVEGWICAECEGIPGAPQVRKGEIVKHFFRTLGAALGIDKEKPIVAVHDFYQLTSRLVTGDAVVAFGKFRGKVSLVVNVASK